MIAKGKRYISSESSDKIINILDGIRESIPPSDFVDIKRNTSYDNELIQNLLEKVVRKYGRDTFLTAKISFMLSYDQK